MEIRQDWKLETEYKFEDGRVWFFYDEEGDEDEEGE